jgi:hypothetical protein
MSGLLLAVGGAALMGCGSADDGGGGVRTEPETLAAGTSALSQTDPDDDADDPADDDLPPQAPPPTIAAGDCGVTLVATITSRPHTRTKGVATFAQPLPFKVPASIPVSAGWAKKGEVRLKYELGKGQAVTCHYDLNPPGTSFAFDHCSHKVQAGADAVADSFTLVIHGSDQDENKPPPTSSTKLQVTLVLDRADGTACDDKKGTPAACKVGVCVATVVACTSPAWSAEPDMSASRAAAAAQLTSGDVLVTGGASIDANGINFLSSCEIFSETTGAWTVTAPMAASRYGHTATRLPDGRVLVAGGASLDSTGLAALSETETFDPSTLAWTVSAPMPIATYFHAATLMKDGDVLVVGAEASSGAVDALVYSTAAGTWSAVAAPANLGGMFGSLVSLNDGRVLAVGGVTSSGLPGTTSLFDPAGGTWVATAAIPSARFGVGAALLPNGSVLVAGGEDASGTSLNDAFVYDVASDAWSAAGTMSTARALPAVGVLPGGGVAIAGGLTSQLAGSLSGADYYLAGTWTAVPSSVSAAYATAVPLPSGALLFAGGLSISSSGQTSLATAQRFGCAP